MNGIRGLLIKFGEIALRGNNRWIFEDKLKNDIEKRFSDVQGAVVRAERGRFLVELPEGANEVAAIERAASVFGVIAVCPCVISDNRDAQTIREIAIVEAKAAGGKTFKVEVKRADKDYPIHSQELAADVGGYIATNTDLKVDVHKPDFTVFVEIRRRAYIYARVCAGLGGLPLGTTGKGMLLLSGGIDSPIAGFLAAKRGVTIEAVYFHSPPYTSERAKEKVIDLAKRLSYYTNGVKLHIVNFTDVQLHLLEHTPETRLTIMLKRSMLRIADALALQSDCQTLITGDSVGQVASQTLHSLNACESAASLPILRPLAAYDKQDIVDIAKKIGTFDISIRPYEDCCTVFVPKHPETKPKRNIIENIERKMDGLKPLIEQAIANIETLEL